MLTPRNEVNDMEKVDEEDEVVGQAAEDMGQMDSQEEMRVEEGKQM